MTPILLALAVFAADPAAAAESSYLLLRNGELIEGDVAKVGDRYLVQLEGGAEVRVAARDVEMHCLDPDEAYLRKQELLAAGDVAGRLRLADWCLRQGLLGRAADELLLVTALAPQHPALPVMERRLDAAVNQPAARSGKKSDPVTQVSLDELERATRRLPPEVVEAFSARVQPLLLNRCGASCCHGERSPARLQLTRAAAGKSLTRRFTQRNLLAVLQLVDEREPARSPLLTVPSAPHGGSTGTIFGERERDQLQLLSAWVRSVAAAGSGGVADAAAQGTGLMQASYEEPLPRGMDHPTSAASHGERPRPLVERPGWEDPFDPEYFNRRFLPQLEDANVETAAIAAPAGTPSAPARTSPSAAGLPPSATVPKLLPDHPARPIRLPPTGSPSRPGQLPQR